MFTGTTTRIVWRTSIVFPTRFQNCCKPKFVSRNSTSTAAILLPASSATDKRRRLNLKSVNAHNITTQNHPFLQKSAGSILNTMNLADVCAKLEQFAPTCLAESWDNVGLLVEPTPPHHVHTMILTNDLTEEVLKEAIDKKANLILSYHPPIFVPLKKLTMKNAKERMIIGAVEKRIAVYSPHTSFDAVAGGVNDWLAQGIGPCEVKPIQLSHRSAISETHKLEYTETPSCPVQLPTEIAAQNVTKITTSDGVRCALVCNEEDLRSVLRIIDHDGINNQNVHVTKLQKPPIPDTGVGRICKLVDAITIATLVQRVKKHLKLQHVQLAIGHQKNSDSEIHSVAVCAGSGASVLSGVAADVYLTGEMSHHDILAAVAMGTSVIVCNHSNTERGYLTVLKSKLESLLEGNVDVIISEIDADPLVVV